MLQKNKRFWLISSILAPVIWVLGVVILANSFWMYLVTVGLLLFSLTCVLSFLRRKKYHKLLVVWTAVLSSFCLVLIYATFLGTKHFAKELLTGESLTQSPTPANQSSDAYIPRQTPPTLHSNYDCAKLKSISSLNKWCYIVAGNPVVRDTPKLDHLGVPLPNDWRVASGKKESTSNAYFQIYYPPEYAMTDADSGPIYIKRDNEVVLTIEYISAKSDFEGNTLKAMAENKAKEYSILLESNQKFAFSDITLGWRNFRNGKKYLLLSYPYYWQNVPDQDTPVYSLEFKDPQGSYTPDFSAHNEYDYYIGDTGTNAIVIIYDWKKLPEEHLNLILQNLKVWIR